MTINKVRSIIRKLKLSATKGIKNCLSINCTLTLNKPGYTVAKYLLNRKDLTVTSIGGGLIKVELN